MEDMKTLNFIKDYGSTSTGPSIQYLLCKNAKFPFGDGKKTVSFLKKREIEQTYFFITLFVFMLIYHKYLMTGICLPAAPQNDKRSMFY